MYDKSSLDNLQIIRGEDDMMEKFGSEKSCEWSRFGYAALYEIVCGNQIEDGER